MVCMESKNYAGAAMLDGEGRQYFVTVHDFDSGELELLRYNLKEVDDEWHELQSERITRTLDELDDEGWSLVE